MKANNDFFKFLEQVEGFETCPYWDNGFGSTPTIGIGTTRYEDGRKVKITDTCISYDRAVELVRRYTDPIEPKLDLMLPSGITQNQYNALLSFAYNLGLENLKISTLLKKVIKDPSDPNIGLEFLKWNKIRDPKTNELKTSKGLTRRRLLESSLYFKKEKAPN